MSQNNKNIVIGITGPIGSGKSYVLEIMREHGYEVIDADDVVHKLYRSDQKLRKSIKRCFGKEVFDKENRIDRKQLAEIIFNSTQKRKELNNIVHDRVYKKIKQNILKMKSENRDVVIEASVPDERFLDICDQVWLVNSDESVRMKRIRKRSNMTKEQVEKRFHAQKNDIEYENYANKLVSNNGTKKELKNKIDKLIQEL